MSKRIMTQRPDPEKAGTNIARAKYNVIRSEILRTIRERGEITFRDLGRTVRDQLQDRFDGSVSWNVTTVKLDLEARGLMERKPGSKPQRLRLASQPQDKES
jgi:hypothetical protein